MKRIATALTALMVSAQAVAGTDTIVHFANLSPYTATVSFPAADADCWHDTGAEDDSRIAQYFDYYKRDAVSDKSYADFLKNFKKSYGIADFATVPSMTMSNTSMQLGAAGNGKPVQMGVFRGETSANLFDGCKDATSSRGFTVTLTDTDGTQLSTQRYLLQDPPGREWTLSRRKADGSGALDTTLMLGSGGKASAIDIALTAGTAILTIVSIGSATAELIAARALYLEIAAELMAKYGVEASVSTGRWLFNYALVGGLRTTAYGVVRYNVGYLNGVAARIVYTSLVDGALVIYDSVKNDSDPNNLGTETADPDYSQVGVDFASPSLVAQGGLPDDRSICVYQTDTLGIPECRLVGINLAIMPDGSIVFMPLPSVGSGN